MTTYENMAVNNEGFSTHNTDIHLVKKTRCERMHDNCQYCRNNYPVCVGLLGGLFIGLIIGAMSAPNHCDDHSPAASPPGMNIVKNVSNITGSPAQRGDMPPCNMNGQMYNGTCYCNNGYIGATCDYKQKKQVVAFCLEFFLGVFGAGFFYMGLNGLAVGQLMTFLSAPILMCFLACLFKESFKKEHAALIEIVWRLAWLMYWIVGAALIGANKLNDGNNMPLEKW